MRHPLLGTGPGQFRAATSRLRTVAIARAETPDRLYVDAHNLVVEFATTTGLLGLAALLAWLLLASRRASGPLLGFALAVLAAHLLEPQSVRTTPMALLALGAAGPTLAIAPLRRVGRAATAMLAALALAGGARLLAGDFHLKFAQDEVARRLGDGDDCEHRRSVRFLQIGSTHRGGDRLRSGWSAAIRRRGCDVWKESRERKTAMQRTRLTDFLLRVVDAARGPLANPGQISVAGRVVPVRQNSARHGGSRARVNPTVRFGVAIREGNNAPTVVQA